MSMSQGLRFVQVSRARRGVGRFAFLLLALGVWLGVPGRAPAAVVINEVMASNAATVPDPQGEFDDWIELYNTGAAAVDVGGLYLTDDADEPTQWQIPTNQPNTTTIPPQGYLLVWADGDVGASGLHANFSLSAGGEEIHLFEGDGVTELDGLGFEEQTPNVSYGRYPDGGDTWRFCAVPTPGRTNNEGYLAEVAPLRFSHERGFYEMAFSLVIETATEDANIIYTVDGRAPNATGGRSIPGRPYTGPIYIGKTTCVRAMALKTGWKPTPIYTHTYVVDSSIPVRSLPMVSLVADAGKTFYEPDGIMAIVGGTYNGGVWTATTPGSYNNMLNRELERPVSAEWVVPGDDEGFHIDCGLRVHGSDWTRPRYYRQNGYWAGEGKISLRLYFRGDYGPSRLQYPLFPLSNAAEFATVILRAGHNDRVNPFIKDELLRRLHRDMGQVACMGTFANLFINSEYKGYYNPTEQVKEESCQQWFDSEQGWDVISMSGTRDGDAASWNEAINYARTHNLADPTYYAEMGNRIDVVSFIDYLIIRLWPNDWDWPQNNWAAARERSPAGRWKFFLWDAEGTFEPGQLSADRFPELNTQGNANGYFYRALKANKDFRLLFADRLYRHFYHGGALTDGNIQRHFYEMQDVLKGVIPSMSPYIINTWTPSRRSIFINACSREGLYTFEGPSFVVNGTPQYGGHVAAGEAVQLVSSRTGLPVLYTLDGSDPAQSTMPPKPTVLALVTRESPKRVLVPTRPDVGDWRGLRPFDDSGWTLSSGSPGGIGYERSTGYEAYLSTNVGDAMYNLNSSCYLRLPFTFAGDRTALKSLTLKVQYDDGFIAYLNSNEVARRNFEGEPAWNSGASLAHDDTAAVVFESIDISEQISRLRQGDNLLAIHGLNAGTGSSDFLITVELTASQEEAATEVPAGPLVYSAPISLTKSTRLRARVQSGTVWSALADATFAVGPVRESLRLSELMYHPADPNTEYVELTNIGSAAVNLDFVRFADGIDVTLGDTSLAPGGFCLVVKDRSAFEAKYGPGLPVVGQYTGSLDNAGERLELQDAAGATIQSLRYRDTWFRSTDGEGYSLTSRDPALPVNTWSHESAWRPSVAAEGAPGIDDGGTRLAAGTVVISELLANSAGLGPDWIELQNTTDSAVDLGGWFLSDESDNPIKYEVAPGTTLPAQGYLLFTESRHFGNASDPGCHEPFALSRSGETLYLYSGAGGRLTGYRERASFGPSDPGATFGRCADGAGGARWALLREPTPGLPNAEPLVGPIVISEILYHAENATDVEFVELLNISDANVTLYDPNREAPWRFTDDPNDPGLELLFPHDPPLTLGPYGCLLLVKDRTLFESRFTVPASTPVLEWGAGSLSNSGETIQLSRPGEWNEDGTRDWICVDRVTYSDGSRPENFPTGFDSWPQEADGQGMSLTRTVPDRYGDDWRNWRASRPSLGTIRQRPVR